MKITSLSRSRYVYLLPPGFSLWNYFSTLFREFMKKCYREKIDFRDFLWNNFRSNALYSVRAPTFNFHFFSSRMSLRTRTMIKFYRFQRFFYGTILAATRFIAFAPNFPSFSLQDVTDKKEYDANFIDLDLIDFYGTIFSATHFIAFAPNFHFPFFHSRMSLRKMTTIQTVMKQTIPPEQTITEMAASRMRTRRALPPMSTNAATLTGV